jgi:hypothetical protein
MPFLVPFLLGKVATNMIHVEKIMMYHKQHDQKKQVSSILRQQQNLRVCVLQHLPDKVIVWWECKSSQLQLHLHTRGQGSASSLAASSSQGPHRCSRVIGAAPEVLGNTHTSVASTGNGHPTGRTCCRPRAISLGLLLCIRMSKGSEASVPRSVSSGREFVPVAPRAVAAGNSSQNWRLPANATMRGAPQ